MEDNVIDVEEIAEKGITVTTVVAEGITETAIQQSGPIVEAKGQSNPPDIALIQNPSSAGNPLLQHDLAVRDVHAGVYGDFSADAAPTDSV